jgi:hypothetical protein
MLVGKGEADRAGVWGEVVVVAESFGGLSRLSISPVEGVACVIFWCMSFFLESFGDGGDVALKLV